MLVIALAACGGGDDDGSDAAVANEPTATTLSADQQFDADVAAIGHKVEELNTAFTSKRESDGQNALANSNYLIWTGEYTTDQCYSSWADNRPGVLQHMVLHEDSIAATPDWTHPVVGIPEGRVYSFTVDMTYRLSDRFVRNAAAAGLSPFEPPDDETTTVHATVLPDGSVKLFDSCD
jgi:hypothetical protein